MVKQQLHRWVHRLGIRVLPVNRKTFRQTSWVVSCMCLTGVGVAPALAQTAASTGSVELAQTYDLVPPPPDGAIPGAQFGGHTALFGRQFRWYGQSKCLGPAVCGVCQWWQ